jgi:hypothetical protein
MLLREEEVGAEVWDGFTALGFEAALERGGGSGK